MKRLPKQFLPKSELAKQSLCENISRLSVKRNTATIVIRGAVLITIFSVLQHNLSNLFENTHDVIKLIAVGEK